MEFGLLDIIKVIGSLGFFIYGMKVMSEGIQKAAGDQLKRVLGTMTKNQYLGVISGFLITAVVQSSSATTVMTVSFVNAGLLSLIQSAGIMMGANIGTTITAWLVANLGFKVKVVAFALPIIAVALPMLFIRKGNWRFWAEFLIGFALLFMGLDLLKGSVPDIKHNPDMLEFLQGFANWGYASYIIFIFIGTLLTIVVQSSSASMTITLVLVAKGWISFDVAAAMVLGENIGTTITAELASIVGNVHAKRSARIHSMFNIIGVGWMLLIFPFFLEFVYFVVENFMGMASLKTIGEASAAQGLTEEAMKDRSLVVTSGLAAFHTMFNFINVVLLIGFAPKLASLAVKMVKPKDDDDEKFSLEYIGSGLMASVELSLLEAKKEITNFGGVISKMMKQLEALIQEKDSALIKKKLKKIKKYEDICDQLEIEVGQYLIKLSETELSERSSIRIRSMLSIINDLERTADVIYQMSRTIERKVEEKIWFTPGQRERIVVLFDKVNEAIVNMQGTLEGNYESANIDESKKIEKEINELRSKFRKQHLKSIEKGDYNIKAGLIYVDIIASAEKLGDHIYDVCEATKGDV
ncbi:MAG: Na/Pi cotransporter [Crocinitomicaceae bacterium]|nr:Na/Pi cotransporter [Crocinitomicaceae bacterium]|tara:strand:- start:4513 stop:6255 length:1743 start_codon:yes stop_codon:yes gene_type:complete